MWNMWFIEVHKVLRTQKRNGNQQIECILSFGTLTNHSSLILNKLHFHNNIAKSSIFLFSDEEAVSGIKF